MLDIYRCISFEDMQAIVKIISKVIYGHLTKIQIKLG